MAKTNSSKVACCSPRQKIYGIIALVGLFACGVMIGLTLNGNGKVRNDDGCAAMEEFLLPRVNPINSDSLSQHDENIEIYKILIKKGCAENVEKYNAAIQRESAIIEILKNNRVQENGQICKDIEQLLSERVNIYPSDSQDGGIHIARAQIYASLSERGCAENRQHYVDMAAKELEIARALQDDRFGEGETFDVVETYKRLEMKQAASEVLDKVQKLTDPAIDFILQVQKIIEE